MKLRKATTDDIPEIVRMARLMVGESSFAVMGVDSDRMATFLSPLITHGFVVVAEKDGGLVGAMLGDVVTPWYGQKRMGIEYAVYLQPEHRHGLIAARMIRGWVDWCKANRAVQCRAGVTTGNDKLERLYLAYGFERCGGNFVLNF